MNRKEKRIVAFAAALALAFGVMPSASAMHIMEGALPASSCIAWGVLSIPFLIAGFFSIKKTLNHDRSTITLLAMSGAFVFVISSLKIPSVTGSCSHMTGTGLGAIVLVFQAILLAHGGLTTIGANIFSMSVAGPFVSYGIFAACNKMKVNKKISVFLAATLGDLFTYCITAFQLAFAHHADTTLAHALGEFLVIFAPTQIPLAIVGGILTVLIITALESFAKTELKAVGFIREGK